MSLLLFCLWRRFGRYAKDEYDDKKFIDVP